MRNGTLKRTERGPAVVMVERHSALALRRIGPGARLAARLRATRLDHLLAAGSAPESTLLLAIHASRLYSQGERHRLAANVRHLAAQARGSCRAKALIDREGVRRAEAQLETVAQRLESDMPMDVRGIARVRTLLSDGASPLYRRCSPGVLRRELASTLDALSPIAV